MGPVLLVLLVAPAIRGQAAVEDRTAVIEGTITNSQTGEPVRRAPVSLQTHRPRTASDSSRAAALYSAITGADGKYRIEGVEPGTYFLSARHARYLEQGYGAQPGVWRGSAVKLAAGEKLKLDVSLTPHSVITGRVLDEDGEPLATAAVMVLREAHTARGRPLTARAQIEANDIGEYRQADLAAGRYWIVALDPNQGGESRNASRANESRYVATYYPGVTDVGASQAIDLGVGQRMTGIDIRMQKTRAFRISGRVTGLAPGQRSVRLAARSRDRGPTSWFLNLAETASREDGSFELRGVPPGSYSVATTSNVLLELSPPAVIEGR